MNMTPDEHRAFGNEQWENRKCKNCGEQDERFGKHNQRNCPFESRHGVDWPEDHVPVKPLAEIKNVNPVLVPDEDTSTLEGAVSTITGTASGTKVALPIIIDRQYKHVEQSNAATATMHTNQFIIAPTMYMVGTILYLLGALVNTPLVVWNTLNR